MIYDVFQKIIMQKVQSKLGEDYLLSILKIPKNNGMVLSGLCVRKKGDSISPTVYLESYYQRFQEGESTDTLAADIVRLCTECRGSCPITPDLLDDFSRLRDRVAMRLIHTRSNEVLLQDTPSVPWLDLSIVFYLLLDRTPSGTMTVLIRSQHMELWHTDVEELHRLAAANTPRLLPPRLESMTQVLKDCGASLDFLAPDNPFRKEEAGDSGSSQPSPASEPHDPTPLYVLTNSSGVDGACAMLYPDVLKNFAAYLKKDLIILPSSIHEVLLVPDQSCLSANQLTDMILQANEEVVSVQERLSDHAYRYCRQTDTVVCLPSCSCKSLS